MLRLHPTVTGAGLAVGVTALVQCLYGETGLAHCVLTGSLCYRCCAAPIALSSTLGGKVERWAICGQAETCCGQSQIPTAALHRIIMMMHPKWCFTVAFQMKRLCFARVATRVWFDLWPSWALPKTKRLAYLTAIWVGHLLPYRVIDGRALLYDYQLPRLVVGHLLPNS